MKFTALQAVLGSAALLASLPECAASSAHRRLHLDSSKKLHAHKHHHKHPAHHETQLAKRGQCAFPTDEPDLVAVTPGSQNAGWAMSPDQPCLPGHYCPYACKPGMVMAQWDPKSTYSYPDSMNGGLFCDKSGTMQKSFPSKPLCVQGTGAVKAVNKLGGQMSWCQTVLPGNEAMLIPTVVGSIATLAVPDTSYWQSTASHFYINGPGTGASDCIWGEESQPIGNWAPYVAGANTDGNGNTFVKIGMNPIWEDCELKHSKPSWGVKIECDGGGCNGLPCSIEPGTASITGGGTAGAGGAAFCVVTVPKGSSANIVVYGGDGGAGSDGDSDGDDGDSDDGDSDADESSTTSTSAAAPTSSAKAQHAAGFAEQHKTTSSATSTTTSAESSTTSAPTSADSTTSSHAKSTSTSSKTTTTEEASSTTASATSSETTDATSTSGDQSSTSASLVGRPTVKPGIFHENSTSSSTSSAVQNPSKSQPVVAPTQHRAEAVRHSGGAFAGLVIAFIATACLF